MIARVALAILTIGASIPSAVAQPTGPSATCDSENACPESYYCDAYSLFDGGSCKSCEALASAGPYGCDNEWANLARDSCRDACSDSWLTCTEDTPCPDGTFCTHELGTFNYDPLTDSYTTGYAGNCFGCDRINDPLACYSVYDGDPFFMPGGQDSCASACFQECTDDASCPGGTFCNYQNGNAGYCSGCDLFEKWSECFDDPLTDQGGQSCASVCFGCSASEPCRDGWFCDYRFGDVGYCNTCDLVDENTGRCAYSWIVPDSAGVPGEESCLDSCFDGCSSDSPCQDESFFCDFQVGGDVGYCSSCLSTVAGNPLRCADPNVVSAFGEESCLDTCFNECSSDVPCLDGSFCTSTDNGHCMDCEELDGNPGECLGLDISDESRLLCLSSCFPECSVEDDDCPDWRYCNDVFETGETGYCEEPEALKSDPFILSSCKFCPDITPSRVRVQTAVVTQTPTAFPTEVEIEEDVPTQTTVDQQEPTEPPADNEDEGEGNELGGPLNPPQQEPTEPPADNEDEGEGNEQGGPLNSPSLLSAGDGVCEFCPNNDVQYPEREIRIFENIQCSKMVTWAPTHLSSDTRDCQLAQMNQHICGCSAVGRSSSYAGASTRRKQMVLAWLPRCMALLSIVGSCIIIADIGRHEKRRMKTFGQLMILLSSFDLLASIAYAFTTLPTPAEDYVYGSRGNAQTCTAQGFFVSMGVVACLTNVSLAVYYLLMLKMGWSENRIKRQARVWLLSVPVVIGLIFSFAGIPFYQSIILWCSNASNYWPDIPVAVAIGIATIVMGMICFHVHREEKASAKWRGAGGSPKKKSMASMVMWQSVWYLASFYMVWPPYLALQYLWASGRVYDKYGFILFAGTLVPLQGFWNCITYMRPRMQNRTGRDKEGLRSRFVYPCLRSVSNKLSTTLSGIAWASSSSDPKSSTATASAKTSNHNENALSDVSPQENAAEGDNELVEEGGKPGVSDPADIAEHASLFCSSEVESGTSS